AVETLKLGFFINVKPELDYNRSSLCQNFFKFVNLSVSPFPFLLTAETFDPFYQDTTVPAPIENCYMSSSRDSFTETPEVMMSFFNVIGRAHWDYSVKPGIEIFYKAIDISPFACGIPALKNHNHWTLFPEKFVLESCKLLLVKLF